jgi:hypothetical protein
MLKTALLVLLALVVAIGGGAASVWYALSAAEGVGAVTIGGWSTYPDMGTPDADPYSRARVAREGLLTLGRAEGLAFVARRDSAGEPLLRECRYTIEGMVPPAHIWTVYAADRDMAAITPGRALNAQEALFQPDSSLKISVGTGPAPGNWLATSGRGPMAVVLTLYDTPAAVGTGVSDIALPRIVKVGCDV